MRLEAHPPAVAATLRAFVDATGALRAVAVLDRGTEPPLMIDLSAGGEPELVDGEESMPVPDDGSGPLALPPLQPVEPMAVDPESGTVTAAIGALEQIAAGVREAAALLPGRSTFLATFASTVPDAPLTIAARPGDAIVLAIGDRKFEAPPDWPSGA